MRAQERMSQTLDVPAPAPASTPTRVPFVLGNSQWSSPATPDPIPQGKRQSSTGGGGSSSSSGVNARMVESSSGSGDMIELHGSNGFGNGGITAAAVYADISTAAGANSALNSIEQILTDINTARSSSGAIINRLEYAADNLANVSQNTSASRSRILDADYASETTELARTQIIQQAGTAMLSQANQMAQSVLSLLK